MVRTQKGRITASTIHALLFGLTSVVFLISDRPILDGPGAIPFVVLLVADIPISIVVFSEMFFSAKYGWFAFAAWGVLGTIWWYFLGMSIEAWIRRFSKKSA